MSQLDVVAQSLVQSQDADDRRPASVPRAPVSPRARELVQRADTELLAAQYSSEAWEQFSHAHLAALRAGAAVVASRGTPGGRRPPRTVWAMLHQVAPELDEWTDYFAAGASTRSAVEAGRFEAVTPDRAEQTLCAAEDFVDAARSLVMAGQGGSPYPVSGRAAMLAVRAS
ncbi:SAV_6107 family HEPN domain-containing protein [Cellulomonas rhizosphaerae]|uniref:SAV_6107 family HEPN domain-containing protein n=1 Tax=Cellulomonas rhizosphaerae TaxID=2293719 RepID=UPI001313ECC4|nr:SAV_6107 family HEPN domain-containing protein [Cellulomonas rhizosphaerae]